MATIPTLVQMLTAPELLKELMVMTYMQQQKMHLSLYIFLNYDRLAIKAEGFKVQLITLIHQLNFFLKVVQSTGFTM